MAHVGRLGEGVVEWTWTERDDLLRWLVGVASRLDVEQLELLARIA